MLADSFSVRITIASTPPSKAIVPGPASIEVPTPTATTSTILAVPAESAVVALPSSPRATELVPPLRIQPKADEASLDDILLPRALPPGSAAADIKFNINPKLTVDQIAQVDSVLRKHMHAFAAQSHLPPSESPNVEHAIHLNNPHPVKQAAYRQSPAKSAMVEKTTAELLARGLIQESSSPWSSPIVLVPKPDGEWRQCIDYRKVNARWTLGRYRCRRRGHDVAHTH